jgi:Rieske Fe-S protein
VGTVEGCAIDTLLQDTVVDLSLHPSLEEIDQTVFVEVGLRQPLAITRVGPEPTDFLVTNTECTHLSCKVERDGTGYLCPCHSSRFAIDGAYQSGPAQEDLTSYEFDIDGEIMTIHAA